VPFEKLVEEPRAEPVDVPAPAVPVVLTVQNTARGTLELPGVEVAR